MTAPTKSGGELFIVDNSETEWKGLRYLQDWTEIASAFDIATGFFEIGSLLALDGKWQKLDKIRILMGDQARARTKQAILEGLRQHVCRKLDASLENEKESNDLLAGTAAIVQAMHQGKIQCRVYRSRYAEFLKIDFPRLPLTCDPDFFRALACLGGELVALHLLESPSAFTSPRFTRSLARSPARLVTLMPYGIRSPRSMTSTLARRKAPSSPKPIR